MYKSYALKDRQKYVNQNNKRKTGVSYLGHEAALIFYCYLKKKKNGNCFKAYYIVKYLFRQILGIQMYPNVFIFLFPQFLHIEYVWISVWSDIRNPNKFGYTLNCFVTIFVKLNNLSPLQGLLMPVLTVLGLVGNILSILVLHSPGIDMKVGYSQATHVLHGKIKEVHFLLLLTLLTCFQSQTKFYLNSIKNQQQH